MAWWNKQEEKKPADGQQQEPQPKYITEEHFNAFREDLRSMLRPPEPAPRQDTGTPDVPQIDDITDEEYEAAVTNLTNPDYDGDRRLEFRKVQKREKAQQTRNRQSILEEVGRRTATQHILLDSLSTEVTKQHLNSLPYYSLFKKELDQAIAALTPEQRTVQNVQIIHNAFVGAPENQDKVYEYRKQQDSRAALPDHDIPGRKSPKDTRPKFVQIFGERMADSEEIIMNQGKLWRQNSRSQRDPDDFARSRGYDSANDYAEFAENMMKIESCPDCYMEVIDGKCNCAAIGQFSGRQHISLLR